MKHPALAFAACLLFAGFAPAQDDVSYLPQPFPDEVCYVPTPGLFFSVDFALIQPRLKGTGGGEEALFSSPILDWAVSPRFEIGFANRERWNPYIGYRPLYSDRGFASIEPLTDSVLLFTRSTELHTVDFGVRSAPFCLLSIFKAEWDLSARLTVIDFQDVYDFDFAQDGFFHARARQQFIGAGPRGGLKVELPIRDTGFALAAGAEGGLQWGGYRNRLNTASFDGIDIVEDEQRMEKGGLLWHVGAQAAVKYAWPAHEPRIVYSLGYLYDVWFSDELGMLEGRERGQFDYHGPFVRFEWRF
jgi:hypothetical protein